jgi:hypothetical protein
VAQAEQLRKNQGPAWHPCSSGCRYAIVVLYVYALIEKWQKQRRRFITAATISLSVSALPVTLQVMETNGDRAFAVTPIELLLIAVGGCMASDVVDILRKKRQFVSDYKVEVIGERREDFPRSFQVDQASPHPHR